MKKISVLHLLATGGFSGAENVACSIIENTNVNAYYCSPIGEIKNQLNDKNIKYIPLKKFNISELRNILNTYDIDIIHAHDFKASFLASFFNKKYKIISHLHCNYKLINIKSIVSIVYSNIQKKFSRIFVVSNEILDDAPFGKKIKNKTIVLQNVINPSKVIERSKEFETDKYDLIFVGRLIDLKRPTFFINLIKELKIEKKNIKACIIGQGDLYEECKSKIENEKLNKNIDLLGFLNNPFPYIKNSKVLILPSKFEGLPMTVVESLILDTPVVNSGVGGLKKMYKDYEYYVCDNLNSYKNIVLKIINSKNNKYKNDCKSLRKEFTDIDEYSKKIENTYEEVLNEK